jgi:hypothetical protein
MQLDYNGNLKFKKLKFGWDMQKQTCGSKSIDLTLNQIIQNFQSVEILKERVMRQRTHFLNHLIKQLCSMGSKCLALHTSHMCRK